MDQQINYEYVKTYVRWRALDSRRILLCLTDEHFQSFRLAFPCLKVQSKLTDSTRGQAATPLTAKLFGCSQGLEEMTAFIFRTETSVQLRMRRSRNISICHIQ